MVRVEGYITSSQDAHPISDATVRLETDEGDLVLVRTSSSSGRFDLSELRPIAYRLTITAEGYQPYQESLDLTRAALKTVLTVLLSPAEKQAVAPPVSRTDAAAPRSARKEYQKGVRAISDNKLDEAQAHFQKAVDDYPCYVRAQELLAMALIRRRSMTEAEAALRKAIQCDPDFVKSYLDLGSLLNLEKRYRESGPLLQEGLRRLPGAWKFYYQLGIADAGLGQWPKAEQDYLKTLSLNPSPPAETHVKLADVYSNENAYDKAYAEMAEYLRLEPQGRFAPRIREVMRRMEASGAVHQPPGTASTPPPGL